MHEMLPVVTVGTNVHDAAAVDPAVTVTATQKGALEFYAECWGGTTYSCYVDDVTFS